MGSDVLREYVQSAYIDYTKIFGHSPCTNAFRHFLETGAELTDRTNANGYLVASALILLPPRKILRVFHTKLCKWVYSAGGHIEKEEWPWEAAARELEEETALKTDPLYTLPDAIPFIIHTHSFPSGAVLGKQEHPLYDFVYLYKSCDTSLKADPGSVRYYRWDDIDETTIEHSQETIRDHLTTYLHAQPTIAQRLNL